MNKFKFWRNLLLITSVWAGITVLYIVLAGFENPDCCAIDVSGYRLYPLATYLLNVRNLPNVDCACDINNLPVTFFIVPVDLVFVSVISLIGFVFIQFFSEKKK